MTNHLSSRCFCLLPVCNRVCRKFYHISVFLVLRSFLSLSVKLATVMSCFGINKKPSCSKSVDGSGSLGNLCCPGPVTIWDCPKMDLSSAPKEGYWFREFHILVNQSALHHILARSVTNKEWAI